MGIYLDKTITQKNISTPMFIAALFTMVRAMVDFEAVFNFAVTKLV